MNGRSIWAVVAGVLFIIVGVAATWNSGLGPRWYAILVAVLAIPQCWAGGKLFERRSRPRP